jgi:hypothetical protein
MRPALTMFLTAFLALTAMPRISTTWAQAQENLVIGMVRLEGQALVQPGLLSVSVINRQIADKGINQDGVYLLKIPINDKTFQLWFQAPPGYWHEFSPLLNNDQALLRLSGVVLRRKNAARDFQDLGMLRKRIKVMADIANAAEDKAVKVGFEKELRAYLKAAGKARPKGFDEAIDAIEESWGAKLPLKPDSGDLPPNTKETRAVPGVPWGLITIAGHGCPWRLPDAVPTCVHLAGTLPPCEHCSPAITE